MATILYSVSVRLLVSLFARRLFFSVIAPNKQAAEWLCILPARVRDNHIHKRKVNVKKSVICIKPFICMALTSNWS